VASKGTFDVSRFFAAIDAERRSRELNWKQVAANSGVAASTLTRMGQGRRPDADSLAALAQWSGLNPAEFVRGTKASHEPAPLAMISTYLRSDPHLTDDDARALEEIIKVTYERFRNAHGPETGIQERDE
jgi:transcriptional regulator with XRE-family HTH domain